MATLAAVIGVVLVSGLGLLFVLGCLSRRGQAPGLASGRLQACRKSPNGMCSEFPEDERHYAPPLDFSSSTVRRAWRAMVYAINDCGGSVVRDETPYLAATFRSRVFGFVDDVEFRLDDPAGVIHVRSASRVGYSDFGVNRRRVALIAAAFEKRLLEAH